MNAAGAPNSHSPAVGGVPLAQRYLRSSAVCVNVNTANYRWRTGIPVRQRYCGYRWRVSSSTCRRSSRRSSTCRRRSRLQLVLHLPPLSTPHCSPSRSSSCSSTPRTPSPPAAPPRDPPPPRRGVVLHLPPMPSAERSHSDLGSGADGDPAPAAVSVARACGLGPGSIQHFFFLIIYY